MYPRRSMAAGALALVAALPLFAADKESGSIVVTASRFPDSQFAAPIGARVITADEISESGASDVAEVLNKLGGVHVRQDLFGGSNPGLDLRGFGVTGDQNTLVLVDSIRVSESELTAARLSGIPLAAIEKIEILSGGAVLYGSNSTAGVINIITKQGRLNSREAKLSASGGSFGTRDVRGSVSVGGDQASLELNVQDYHSNNERKNNQVDQQNVSGTFAYQVQSDTRLALNFGSESNRSRLPGSRTEMQWRTDPNGTSTPNDYANTDLWHADLSLTHKIGDFEFAANLVRRDRSTEFFSNDLVYASLSADNRRVTTDEFSPRVKWNARLAGMPNELIAGYDLRNWDFTSKKYDDFGFGFSGLSLETGSQKTQGWYIQDGLQVTTSTLLSLGARSESLDINREVPYALTMTPVDQSDHRRLNAWSLGLRQNLIRDFVAHVRTGTSYRIANIDENRCYTTTCNLLKPQTSRDHELGLAWNGRDVSASVVLFRSDLENELYFNRLAGAFGSNINMTPTRREGVEFASRWDPLSSLSLSARYTLTHATFRSGLYNGVDLAGKVVPVVPRHRASLLANWSITERDQLYAGVNYVGRQHYDNDPANRFAEMPSYTTVDTKYSHRIGDATLALAVNNLFDRKYYSYALVNSPINPTSYNVYPDRSRTVMATFEYKFR